MQNCKTSAGTAAQKSPKSSLLARLPLLLAILMLCAVSCRTNTESKIVITKTLVSESGVFGLVGSGSCLFDYSMADTGYLVRLISNGDVVNSYYCLHKDLDFNIEKMRYQYKQKDSIIMLPSR